MKFPADYPYSPPTIRFLTKVWHPNVYEVRHRDGSLLVKEGGIFMCNSFYFRTATSAYPFCIHRSTIRRAENCLVKDGIQRKTSGKSSILQYITIMYYVL